MRENEAIGAREIKSTINISSTREDTRLPAAMSTRKTNQNYRKNINNFF
jgi:hypothetical protein